MSKPAPVAVALDAPDLETAARWAELVTPHVSTVKVGLELYLRYGPEVVATVRGASRVSVFLDLKLHDIPVTVAGAARAVARLRPEVLTVHAAGGADVVRAVVEAAPGTMVAAVTVLTSLSDDDLGRIGLSGPVPDAVLRLAVLSVEAGAQGLVCSPREVSAVRAEVGDDVTLITPGVRPAWQRGERPGAGGHAGGGAAGRRGPAGDRPPHHPGARPRRRRGGHRRVTAPGGRRTVTPRGRPGRPGPGRLPVSGAASASIGKL